MARLTASVVMAAVVILVATAATPAFAQTPPADPAGSTRLLDVPYLTQTEDLCGGAAMAMVLRYWGDRRVQPEDFASLIDRSAAGIRTDVLTADIRQRGWQGFPIDGAAGAHHDWIRDQIDRGRPIVALIEVRPNRYHYIVIVGWTAAQVIAHDPASAPFQTWTRPDFDRAWAAAGRWAMLVLPSADPITSALQHPSTSAPQHSSAAVTSPCSPLIARMVDLARAGQVTDAAPGLVAATELCPADPAAWRELAGVHFLQSHWAAAAMTAERASVLEPEDEAVWDLLATSRFLNDEPLAALDAWNQIARPSVDIVRVEGVRRVPHPTVVGLLKLPPRTVLTPERQGHAARRLAELPSAAQTSLRYRPLGGGTADIDAIVVERPALPRGVVPIAATLARGWLQDEVRVDAASLAKSGELLTVAWRWWEARPRVAVSLAVPALSWLPGVTTIEGSWERQSYGGPVSVREERRHVGLRVADWASSTVRWNASSAFNRWAADSYLSAGGGVEVRLAGDRVSLGAGAEAAAPLGSGTAFTSGRLSSAWRSRTNENQAMWLGGAAATTVSGAAPFALWPGAGTGHGRESLLRAHPLLDAGVVTGEAFGRRLAHASIEYRHPLWRPAMARVGLAVFADAARAWHRLDGSSSRLHVDAGVGVRLALPGKGGAMRLDVARGMRDQQVVVSAGWQPSWTGQHHE
ncbi:MAG: C39 family peptidase [Acidobacteriota bacterium]|nr:C39 family peptidase [Acidobacteriota bacterium]